MGYIKACLRFQLLVVTEDIDAWKETLLSISDLSIVYDGDTITAHNILFTITVIPSKLIKSLRGCGFHGAINDSNVDIETWSEYVVPLIKFK